MKALINYKKPRFSQFKALLSTTWRNLQRLKRNTGSLISTFIIPGVVFSCFMAVLGYAAEKRGIDYGIYILPASMFQAIMFAAGGSCLAMATDMEDGLMNRLKSMPVSGLVTVGGRLMSDLIRSIAAILAIFVFGALWGVTFSLKEGILAFIYSLILAILLSLIFISRALSSKKPRQAALNIQMIEMQFLFFSTGFIPIETLSEPLKTIIKHQPFSPWIDTLRNILTGQELGTRGLESFIWMVVGLLLSVIAIWKVFKKER